MKNSENLYNLCGSSTLIQRLDCTSLCYSLKPSMSLKFNRANLQRNSPIRWLLALSSDFLALYNTFSYAFIDGDFGALFKHIIIEFMIQKLFRSMNIGGNLLRTLHNQIFIKMGIQTTSKSNN